MYRTSQMLRRRKPRQRMRRETGDGAWAFIMARAIERGLKLRPHRIYQGNLPGDRMDERSTTLLIACLRSSTHG